MPQHLDVSVLGTVLRLSLGELADAPGPDPAGASLADTVRAAWQDAEVAPVRESQDTLPAEVMLPPTRLAERFMETLSSDVTQTALRLRAGELMMLHAGGVALEDGRVIAFVAPSGHGKTTLSRALGERYGYVSDETIAFDDGLRVFPYRKPLSVVVPGRPKQQVAPSAAGLRPLPAGPLRLAAIVLLDRIGAPASPGSYSAAAGFETQGSGAHPDPDQADLPTLRPVPLRDALAPLVAQTSYLMLIREPLQRLATALSVTGGAFVLRYDNAESVRDAFPRLLEELATPADADAAAESWWGEERHPLQGAAIEDAIELVSGETAILAGSQLRLLSDFAAEVWRRAAQGQTTKDICEGVIDRFGAPPKDSVGAAELHVAEMSEELRELGLL